MATLEGGRHTRGGPRAKRSRWAAWGVAVPDRFRMTPELPSRELLVGVVARWSCEPLTLFPRDPPHPAHPLLPPLGQVRSAQALLVQLGRDLASPLADIHLDEERA